MYTSLFGVAFVQVTHSIPTPSLSLAFLDSRAHLLLDVMFCIAPHLERCTRHRDGSRRAPRNTCLYLVIIL